MQEYESAIKSSNEEFAAKEKQMTADIAAVNISLQNVSAELESTKGKLDKATAKGKELGDEVKELKGQLSQSQKEHDAAVKSGSALSQQLECVKGEYAAKVQEYESATQKLQTELGCERQTNSTLQAQVIQCLKTCLHPIKMVLTIISLTKNLKWKK